MSTQQSTLDDETYERHVQTLVDRAAGRVRQGTPVTDAVRMEVDAYIERFEWDDDEIWRQINSIAPDPHGDAYDRLKRQAGDLEESDYPRLKAIARVYCDVRRRLAARR